MNHTCPHGINHYRAVDWVKGEPVCDACEEEAWMSGRVITLVGLVFIAAMVFVPVILMLCGAFWNWK